jgi:hypothetical protein
MFAYEGAISETEAWNMPLDRLEKRIELAKERTKEVDKRWPTSR